MTKTILWLWLSLKSGISVREATIYLTKFGCVDALYEADSEKLYSFGVKQNHRKLLKDKSLENAQSILKICKEKNIRIITQDDKDYPDRLLNISSAPLVIYVRGELPNIDEGITLSVVGTRRPTSYGRVVAKDLVSKLSKTGCTVVSGMAFGIDTIANEHAIKYGTKTVAVLGCGVDVCYPPENQKLMENIINNGAVISEYPPGTQPNPKNFPQRNRIISGLSLGTIVVEAPKKSGALITARLANEQGHDVFAVPGNINSVNSQGCNLLIRDGAYIATCLWDILEPYEPFIRNRLEEEIIKESFRTEETEQKVNNTDKTNSKEPENLWDKITGAYKKRGEDIRNSEDYKEMNDEERAVFEAIAKGSSTPDMIIEQSGIPASKAMSAITILELGSIIKRENGHILLNTSTFGGKKCQS